jgi:L-2-hydroxyglutarate oxidase
MRAMARTADIAVVGAGLVGLATAHALATTHRRRVVVFEKEPHVAAHQSSHNSGVIHSGLYYAPGSARARLCTEGRVRMVEFCRAHGIAHDVCGKIVVATCEDELPRLEALRLRGLEHGLAVTALTPREFTAIEPHAAGLRALHVPESGIADYPAVARTLAQEIAAAGGAVECRAAFRRAQDSPAGVRVEVSDGVWEVGAMVACAGLQADRVAAASGVETDIVIAPFRGEYYTLAPARQSLVRNLIYPVPDPRFPFLGVHFTRMAAGGVEAGPNAVIALAREGYTWGDVSIGDLADFVRSRGAHRHRRDPPLVLEGAFRGDAGAPRAVHHRRRPPPRRRRRTGDGAHAAGHDGGRLRLRRTRADGARAERAVAGGHGVARHRSPRRHPRSCAHRLSGAPRPL